MGASSSNSSITIGPIVVSKVTTFISFSFSERGTSKNIPKTSKIRAIINASCFIFFQID